MRPLSRASWITSQLAEATFQQFISIFENFFLDLLRFWLMAYLQSLSGKKVDFQAVLDAPNKDAITLMGVNKELTEILYERPTGWFKYLEDKVKLGCPTSDEIDRIAEAKASRDVLVHYRGVASKIYEAKAGQKSPNHKGERRRGWNSFRHATFPSSSGPSQAATFTLPKGENP